MFHKSGTKIHHESNIMLRKHWENWLTIWKKIKHNLYLTSHMELRSFEDLRMNGKVIKLTDKKYI